MTFLASEGSPHELPGPYLSRPCEKELEHEVDDDADTGPAAAEVRHTEAGADG